MDLTAIQKVLPHRYPFLLVDRILAVEAGRRAVGQKNVSGNEWYFSGHFPGQPVMPGVLIMEALAQVGAVALLSLPEFQGRVVLFGGMDGVRFRRQVVPGDVLRLETEIIKLKGRVGKGYGRAWVGEEMAAEGELLFAVGEKIE
ncbi:MAG: 3-hydroxyacyl-[acyl-carrier-protein] dehydratase [Moorella sp. (in: firmicutes)]|jgi:3-hydroxyacyl-[acyl-carrier-protein] dehydratase|uniref:3-hydroxyacyl-ACP dehydratase FabZ n=1 Tax=unclassified Neomoorella TaxID=2676739 RepID=UPI0010FFB355|nr:MULTISPECIES: 3-hydroxyacyl-ACP dehydratase FabZ [unclassified Moorella (in: firmicutes)]MDK2816984.1 3-hydroxyacyl-[acyl-carrier-protein] dehydratase [Moorella sp. (in: firmicutes)]MDK2895058.1 3-hydroxyacyl-[acyl-carrier-protein] dehydratase [Moorella sp. (in: firmicutes)]GEA14698.1 3-hydroxyacyl-[acyl-carrier-protein] dehydratase FabZ [Moorella sp. E308F]GEA17928.1 3-hydroxyacyl-[acyl-carrier-protein] dehydratase FabZ [Moorella sp. E306M]